jgi:hypothetical protein
MSTINTLATAKAKDPRAEKDYTMDWSAWLAGDTIQTSTWEVEPLDGLELFSGANSTTAATIWVRGGEADTRPIITNKIVTVAGRKNEASILIPIQNQ